MAAVELMNRTHALYLAGGDDLLPLVIRACTKWRRTARRRISFNAGCLMKICRRLPSLSTPPPTCCCRHQWRGRPLG